jgi:chemotaxis protein CheD
MIPLPASGDTLPPQVFLMPGALCCPAAPTLVTTVLGSCVAVCLWDGALGLGGMNHYVLPDDPAGVRSLRYGVTAIDALLEAMLERGCRAARLEAKIFGGAAVLSFGAPDNNVGTRNVAVALERLTRYRIPVKARRTGGLSGLWLQLSTGTGEVLTRALAA